MQWLVSNGVPVPVGSEAGDALASVVTELVNNAGGQFAPVLSDLLSGSDELTKSLIDTLLSAVGDDERVDTVRDLLVTLHDLELRNERDNDQDGKIDWGGLRWTTKVAGGANRAMPVALELGADFNAYFEVLKDETRRELPLPPGTEADAIAKLAFEGRLNGKGGLDGSFSQGALKASASGDIRRGLAVHLDYPVQTQISGLALAGALRRIPTPTSLQSVANAFAEPGIMEPHLAAVEYNGGQGLGGEVSIAANVIVAGSPVPISIGLGAKARYGKSFRIIVTKARGTGDVEAKIINESQTETGAQLEMGLKLGLSDIAPGAARDLLKAVARADDVIEKIDSSASDALKLETWLKPGTFIRNELEDLLKELLQTSGRASQSDQEAAAISWPEFAALFGFEKPAGKTRNAAANDLAAQASDLFAGLVDDLFDVEDPKQGKLKGRLSDALKTGFSEKVVSVIEEKFLDQLPDLQARLDAQAKQLDGDAVSALQKALGQTGVSDKVELFRGFLKESRRVLSEATTLIQKAQTDLLAIELSAWRSTEREAGFAFGANFDADNASAQNAFQDMVLRPGSLGDWLNDGGLPNGVRLDGDWTRYSSLHTKEGVRWSLALIDATAISERTLISEVYFLESDLGVSAYAKQERKKTQKLLNEARVASFVNAHRLWYSRGDIEREGKLAAPSAAPTFEVSFSHRDGDLELNEAEQVLSGFVTDALDASQDTTLVQQRTLDALLATLRARMEAKNGQKIRASLSTKLAVPASRVQELFERAGNVAMRDTVIDITKRSLATHDIESIQRFAEAAVRINQKPIIEAFEPAFAVSSETGERLSSGIVESPEDALTIINASDAILRKTQRTLRRMSNDPMRLEYTSELGAMKRLPRAVPALFNAFSAGARLYASMNPDMTDGELSAMQKEITRALDPLLAPGWPLPDFLSKWFGMGEKAPKRMVALFAALTEITEAAIQVEPPTLLGLTIDNEPPSLFL